METFFTGGDVVAMLISAIVLLASWQILVRRINAQKGIIEDLEKKVTTTNGIVSTMKTHVDVIKEFYNIGDPERIRKHIERESMLSTSELEEKLRNALGLNEKENDLLIEEILSIKMRNQSLIEEIEDLFGNQSRMIKVSSSPNDKISTYRTFVPDPSGKELLGAVKGRWEEIILKPIADLTDEEYNFFLKKSK